MYKVLHEQDVRDVVSQARVGEKKKKNSRVRVVLFTQCSHQLTTRGEKVVLETCSSLLFQAGAKQVQNRCKTGANKRVKQKRVLEQWGFSMPFPRIPISLCNGIVIDDSYS